jgi:hypothetical protein
MRIERSKVPREYREKRNLMRHWIRNALKQARNVKMNLQIRECQSKMNRKDPTAIWKLIEQITMMKGGTMPSD